MSERAADSNDGPLAPVVGLDHIVLRVMDPERSAHWYRDLFGMEILRLDAWRAGQVPFVSVRVDPSTIIDLFAGDVADGATNLDHFAIVVDADVDALAESGQVNVVRGPRRLFGAQGHGRGIYIEDPDHNLVELRNYAAETDGSSVGDG